MSVKVFKNKKEIDCKSEHFLHSPKTLLLHFNEAAYTTTRTVNFTNILDYKTHFQRLAYGALRKIYPSNWGSNEVNEALSEKVKAHLSSRIVSEVRYSLLSFISSQEAHSITEQQIEEISNNFDNGNEDASRGAIQQLLDANQNLTEARIYIILSPVSGEGNLSENKSEEERDNLILDRIDNEVDYWIYIEQLPDRKQIASLEIRHHKKREHADLKSVEWVKERQELENLLLSRAHLNINESVLMDPVTHQLFEGLSSNFFILDQSDRIITAENENVLVGTIMKIILDICYRLNIPVIRTPPTYDQLQSAKSVFISSTSRLLLPADKVYYPENEGGEIVLHYDYNNSILQKIQTELIDNLLSNSYNLFK